MSSKEKAIIIGTSHTNDLGLIRSLGEAKIKFYFILVGENDPYYLKESKYLKNNRLIQVKNYTEAYRVLCELKIEEGKKSIICTNDSAAEFIDHFEADLSKHYRTPMKGGSIGIYFNKENQCRLASECGLIVPKSIIIDKESDISHLHIDFPILTKPLKSSEGSKRDIHICYNRKELSDAINREGACESFIVQEYITKEFEINTLGVKTENGIIWGGAIKKYRHYPPITGSATYAHIQSLAELYIDIPSIERFLNKVGYFGLFSVEFIRKDGINYFMEVNMRNDGLGYTATCAGKNLAAYYIEPLNRNHIHQFKSKYMMNLFLDFKTIFQKQVSITKWIKQLFKTSCFLDYNNKDIKPFFYFFLHKLHLK